MNQETYFEKVKTYKYLANKSLGQNFLINPQTAGKIVENLQLESGEKVLEIGAGLGSLSYFLVESKCDVDLIDIDERMLSFLNENFGSYSNVRIRRQNILKQDLSGYDKIIGNLPYYITSGIIEHILVNAKDAKRIVLMSQKEVYPKLLKDFKSPLSLLLNYVCDISSPLGVSRNNFTPVPHVDSVVFTLVPNENIKNTENKDLLKLMQQLFLHRRKTILNCLQNITKDKIVAEKILHDMNINSLLRPEQLDINFYISLLKVLKSTDFNNRI